MYHVYILKCGDGTLYTGVTTDLKRRLAEHKQGTGAKYTRARGVAKCIYSETARNRSAAQKREAEIKSWRREQKLALIKIAKK